MQEKTAVATAAEGKQRNGHEDKKIRPVPQLSKQDFTNEIDAAEPTPNTTWKDFLVLSEPEEIPPLIHFNNVPVATPGNHSLIIGKKKSRKTLFIVWFIAQFEGAINTDVLICDTEQGKRHVWKTLDRIERLTGARVHILSLRGLSPVQRKEVILQAIQEGKYKIVVIDGVRDLLSNINDPDQSTELITWIEFLTVTYNLHIVDILHQNKTDNNARGHLGSELLNKAEITIELELDEKAGCTIVKCESSRDIPFESFAFTHNEDGLPEVVSMPTKGKVITDSEKKRLLEFVFEGQLLKYKDVRDGIKTHFDVGINKASSLLAGFCRNGWIIKNGADRHPDTTYKLMVSAHD